jgi:predicted permease
MHWRPGRGRERDLERELRSHLELEALEQEADGLAPDRASYAARRAFGNTTLVQEEIREMSRWMLLDRLRQDLHYAFRTLGRNRGFTAVAILTLALGIGANTAVFSLLNAVELRRLPVRDPQQLVMLEWTANKKADWRGGSSSYNGCDARKLGAVSAGCSFSYPDFDYFRSRSRLLSGLAAVAGPAGLDARIRGEIVHASAQFVSGDFFSVLGVRTQLGRTIDARDDLAGAEPVAVLSSPYWEKHFGSDPRVLGATISLEGAPFNVVGVAAKEFFGLQPTGLPDLWISVHSGSRLGYGWWSSVGADNGWLYLIGRLTAGARPDQAAAELGVLLRQAPGSQDVFTPGTRSAVALAGIAQGLSGLRRLYSDQLHVLMAVVGLVLLIACANIANLLLTRASVRRREMAVRMAIGCSRGRLLQQLITESFLLSALGTAAGLLIAQWASHALAAFLASRTGARILVDVSLDPLVLSFTVAVACLAATLFGLAPALAGTREHPGAALKSGNSSGGRSRFGRVLVAAEMALALVLLIGAGLFVRTLDNLEKLDPGFRRDHLLTLQISRPHDVSKPQGQSPVNPGLRDRLAALPGVLSASWASELLLVGNLEMGSIRLDGRDDLGEVHVDTLRVGPRFFETMGIPVLAGRSVQIQDCQPDATAIWVNRRLAESYGSNVDPLGRVIVRGKTRYQIAGIVGDAKYEELRGSIAPSVYNPALGGGVFVLRTASDPASLTAAVRGAVHDVNPNLIVDNVKSQAAQIDEQLFNEHLMARLSTAFGLLALTMAAIGIYGVLVFSVTRRTKEIAIRMSLGAMPGGIMRLVLRDGLAPASIGAAVGLLASWGLTKLIAALLFGVTALDPLTYIASTFLLLAVAMLACYIPARRATRVSPVVALRYE